MTLTGIQLLTELKMTVIRTLQDEPSFWYLKARQRLGTEIELRALTRRSIRTIESMIRDIQTDRMRPVNRITTMEEGENIL